MEHDWLVGTDADAARARRDLFATLLEAVTPEAQSAGVRRSELLSYRIGAKNAQSRLMEMASFHADDRRARTAANVARRQIGMCDSLVLG